MNPCPFCSITPDRVWIETEHAIAVADTEPLTDRHMLVVPARTHLHHPPAFYFRGQGDLGEVHECLLTGLKPDGFAIGFGDGPQTGRRRPARPTSTRSRAGTATRLNPVPESIG